jgi:DNA (cytosine-5)-methyltransferase 1
VNYYNDNDPKACDWLRELISAGLLPNGIVECKSILDINPDELSGYTQCHFFAGIGGWAYALRLANWPDDKPVWTGSCPCQPLSSAGLRKGHADERHLWPAFYRLIAERNPSVVFGEQVASKDGREWLAGVRADLEGAGYAVGAADLCAAGVGAPHIRQRLYWLADAKPSKRREKLQGHELNGNHARRDEETSGIRACCEAGRMAYPSLSESARLGQQREHIYRQAAWSAFDLIPCRDGKTRRVESILFIDFDGLSCIMGSEWNTLVSRTEEIALNYAKTEVSGNSQAVLSMWKDVCEEAIRKISRGHVEIQSSQILLVALCQSAWSLGKKFDCSASGFWEIQKGILRALWSQVSSARSSHRPELAESSSKQSENLVHHMSHAHSQESVSILRGLRKSVTKAQDVSEALSKVEEIWKSVDDKNRGKSAQEILNFVGIAVGMMGFPLAQNIPARTILLRGAGNAIVPQVAAEFIQAYVEIV